jgi:kynurenine 3-monooxygenase
VKEKIVIIGSGMAGCFMGYCLAKQGYQVEIYEERDDIRKNRHGSGRSFNITLYYRGILALKKAGLWNEIKSISVLTKGNVAHYADMVKKYDPYDAHDTEVLYTVHRNRLNSKLLDIVEKLPNVKIFFNTKCIGIDRIKRTVSLQKVRSQKISTVTAYKIIGADGVNSFVRSEMQKSIPARYIQEHEDWGYKEVHITRERNKLLGLKDHATHTWPRRNSLLIAFPNPDDSFTLMINLPLQGANSFDSLNTRLAIKKYIDQYFPDLSRVHAEIAAAFLKNPTGKFVTIKTTPWSYRDFIVLIGDAAHGVIPFYGQGVCAALDDCLQIITLLKKHKNNWEKAFVEYEGQRKQDTDTLSFLAKENFIELRDRSRSLFYILKDKTDTALNRLFPNTWLPSLYILIAHGTLNYDTAYRLHKRQQFIAKLIGIDVILFIGAGLWHVIKFSRKLIKI